MLDINSDINSLSNFKRNTPEFLRQLKETGHPVVLTINGKAELVVQDTASYQKLIELAGRAERMDALKASIEDMKAGKLVPADDLPFEFLMNTLRLREGFPEEAFEARTGLAFERLAAPLSRLRDRGLMERDGRHWRASRRGFDFLNDLLGEFLPVAPEFLPMAPIGAMS